MGELVTGDGVGEASGDLSLHLRLSFACEPRTRMSCNSSLESEAFIMGASTGNRLLFCPCEYQYIHLTHTTPGLPVA